MDLSRLFLLLACLLPPRHNSVDHGECFLQQHFLNLNSWSNYGANRDLPAFRWIYKLDSFQEARQSLRIS
jgi:hypothetical protein